MPHRWISSPQVRPGRVRPGRPPSFWLVLILLSGLIGGCRRPVSPSPEPMVSPSGGSSGLLKIYVAESGVYEIGAGELQQAGFPAGALQTAELFYQGQVQPLWKRGEGGNLKLHFFAQAGRSLYTGEDVYWLASGGSGTDLSAPASTPAALPPPFPPLPPVELPAGAYSARIHLEENNQYNPQVEGEQGSAGQLDHWLWVTMSAPSEQALDVELEAPVSGPGRLRVAVWASTEGNSTPTDHHLVLEVNGQTVGDETWDGKGHRILQAGLPPGLLKEGANQIRILAPGDTGLVADITFLDWIELDVPRRLSPQDDRLDFTSPGGEHSLVGFSGPVQVFDITGPGPARLLDVEAGSFTGKVGRRYWAAGPKGFLRPARIVLPSVEPDLRATGNGADYLAIGPPDLLAPLRPLLDWRTQGGLQVSAIPLPAIYDQFNAGLPEPRAIRAFLRYAVQHWKPAPRYLLLVGDGSYDPKGYLAPAEANRLPVFLVTTVFGGQTASDVGYAQLNGENWPSAAADSGPLPGLAVGRLPARRPDQVAAAVEKILRFEQEGLSDGWRRQILAVADGQDPSFQADAQGFLDLFPDSFKAELYAPEAGAAGAGQEIRRRIEDGSQWVVYFGHGSLNMWGKDRLFTVEDAAGLSNRDRLPIIVNMTCLTGLFTHPKVESLAEALLWQPDGGAVAVLAPTSLTLPADQSFLSRPLVEEMLADPEAALGDILLRARRQVPVDSEGTRDVLQTFLLFGDPALRLP